MNSLLLSIVLSFALLAKADLISPGASTKFFVDKNQGFCLTAATNEDGAPVTVTSCGAGENNNWVVTAGSLHPGTITTFGDKCLDVTNGVNGDGTKMQIFTCNPSSGNKNQQWVVGLDLTIHWVGTNKCLDNTGGLIPDPGDNPTQIWTCGNNNINQKWFPLFPTFPNGTPPGSTVNFFIPLRGSAGTQIGCLTAASNADGAQVVFQKCVFDTSGAALPGQQWTLSGGAPQDPAGKGTVGTVKVFGNKCLDVPSGNTANGVKLQIFTCFNNNNNQKWIVNGDATIVWSGKNKCVDLTNGGQADGNRVQSWACTNANSNQEWFILPAE